MDKEDHVTGLPVGTAEPVGLRAATPGALRALVAVGSAGEEDPLVGVG